MATKYFQIGMSGCGTTSIGAFFNRSGIPCIDYDDGRLGRRMERNVRDGAPILAGYDHRYDAFTDMKYVSSTPPFARFWGFRHVRRMMADYPDSKYILNTRPVEHWIRTRRSQVPIGDQEPFRQWYYGTTDVDAIADIWRRQWAELHRDVLSAVPAQFLLVFDIESDPPERLCEFAGLPLSCAANYTQENPSLNAVGRFLYPYVGRPLRHVLPRPVVTRLKKAMRARR